MRIKNTSWQGVGKWYNQLVNSDGHYYHQHVIIPKVLRLLNPKSTDSVLDLACGQGVLARSLPKNVTYTGLDNAFNLIDTAKKIDPNYLHTFITHDITQPFPANVQQYEFVTIILALQNVEHPQQILDNAFKHLKPHGKFIIVINHPMFRIPRQTSWGIDEKNKLQYRRVNRYLSPLKIPITTRPGKSQSPITWSFHYPLSSFSIMLKTAGFGIELLEEWTSDKVSAGSNAKMENLARHEFPLFMAICALKLTK